MNEKVRMALTNQIIELLRVTLEVDFLDESAELGEPSEWDSLNHILIIRAIEKKFSVLIRAEDMIRLTSIVKIADFIYKEKI